MPVCRYHGARRPETILKGPDHPNYQSGLETLAAKRDRSTHAAEIRELENLLLVLGMVPPQTKMKHGRKPMGKARPETIALLQHAQELAAEG